MQARHHRLLDTGKLRAQLGYRDAVPAEQALAETARWLVEHPPATGDGRNLDPFDYAAEDRLIGAWRSVQATFEPVVAEPLVWRRSYERQTPAPGKPPSHRPDAASAQ